MPPFTMKIDFAEIVKALKEINYPGYLTLEADAYLPKYYNTPDTVFQGIQNLADSVKKLEEMFLQQAV